MSHPLRVRELKTDADMIFSYQHLFFSYTQSLIDAIVATHAWPTGSFGMSHPLRVRELKTDADMIFSYQHLFFSYTQSLIDAIVATHAWRL